MYKVLIVDDEKMIRMGMSRGLPWESLNVSEVYQASNGFEALDIIREKAPDLMITDINMEGMTGLELIEQARALREGLKIIVLTGYDRFDYARECLRMRVEDLFLKPIDEEVLSKAIQNLIHSIEEERRNRIQESTMRRVRGNTEQMRLERLLRQLIAHQHVSEEELEWMCSEYSFERNQSMQLALLQPVLSGSAETQDEFGLMMVREICIGLVDGQGRGITFQNEDEIAVVFFDNGFVNEVYDRVQELSGILKDEFGTAPRIILGSVVEGFEKLHISYNDARHLIEENRKGIFEILQSGNTGKRNALFQEIYAELKNSMCANVGNSDYVLRVFDVFCQAAESYNLTEDSIRRNCFDLASTVYFTYISSTGEAAQGRLEELMKNIMYASGQDACEVTRMFLSNMFGNEKAAMNDIISNVRRYIDEHLEEELSVSSIAAQFFITPNYFSKLFKKMMGEGCNEYIVRKRIEKARYLLETTSIKTGKIAMMVGYRDTNYFSLAFKKHTGKSPTKYREEMQS